MAQKLAGSAPTERSVTMQGKKYKRPAQARPESLTPISHQASEIEANRPNTPWAASIPSSSLMTQLIPICKTTGTPQRERKTIVP
jgi:hypothetical protein